MRISVIILVFLLGLMGFGQDALAKATYHHPAGHFEVVTNTDLPMEYLEYLANGLEMAREFYRQAGFTVPSFKIKVKLIKGKEGAKYVGGYNPISRKIRLVVLDGDTWASTRFTAAHELFHAVTFKTLSKGKIKTYWINKHLFTPHKKFNEAAEFWLFFEGLAETMAWMVFPDIGPIEDSSKARFWYAPTVFTSCPGYPDASYPYIFVDPWKILPHCTLSQDPEILAYYTIPFWLGLSQRIGGPPINGDYAASARVIHEVMLVVKKKLGSLRVPDAVKAGIDSFLSNHEMERKDIRDMMSLSAGVERFGDEVPLDRDSPWTALFRDFERAGNEIEGISSHLSWAIDYQLAPPHVEKGNTIRFMNLTPYLSPIPVSPLKGQLESFNYAGSLNPSASVDDLPTFAGDMQGIHTPGKHPLDTKVVPPGTIQLMDLTPNPSPIAQPVAVAGYKRPGSTMFFPRMVKIIPGEAPVTLPLHNFQLKDLSVMRVLGRNPNLKYRYTFLDERQSKLGYGNTTLARPGDGEWIIREVDRSVSYSLPTSYLPGASIMLTPATVPKGPADSTTLAWKDSDIFDVVIRSENTATGEWFNVSASTNVYQTTVPFPARKERIRVDIARFEPGNHGGGNFFLTAAVRDPRNPNKPDLLVRASTVEFVPEIVRSGRVPPVSLTPVGKCQPTARIVAYVTNQGDAVASNVNVRIKGKMKITLNKQGTQTDWVSFDQTILVPQDFELGETRAVELRVEAPSRGFVASVHGKIALDPENGVIEHVEINNEADIPLIDYECNS